MTLSGTGLFRAETPIGGKALSRNLFAPDIGKLAGRIGALWRRILARRAERRLYARLSCLPASRLRDMGYDPETLYYMLKGSPYEITPIRERRERG